MYLIVMEGVLEYFSKEQVKICLNMLCDSFPHGYLLAELHSPFIEKHAKQHDAVKHTNATYGWGTKSGKEYLALEPRLKFISGWILEAESSMLRIASSTSAAPAAASASGWGM